MNQNNRKNEWMTYTIPQPIKIAALWIAVMFLYVYADIKTFFQGGILQQIMEGSVAGFTLSQSFLFYGALLMSIPAVMIVGSLLLPPRWNRRINMVLSSLHIALAIAVLFTPGETWLYYYWYTLLEVVCHVLIFWFSMKWPEQRV